MSGITAVQGMQVEGSWSKAAWGQKHKTLSEKQIKKEKGLGYGLSSTVHVWQSRGPACSR
jgi:hypothetical protein